MTSDDARNGKQRRDPAVCTHPGFDESGRCFDCLDVVALAVPVDFARAVAAIQANARVGLPPPLDHDLDRFNEAFGTKGRR